MTDWVKIEQFMGFYHETHLEITFQKSSNVPFTGASFRYHCTTKQLQLVPVDNVARMLQKPPTDVFFSETRFHSISQTSILSTLRSQQGGQC